MKKAFKIILKEDKKENTWGYETKGDIRMGEVVFPFKNDEIDLKKGDIVYFQDDYAKKFTLEGKEYTSTNPSNLVCQK